MSDPRHRTAASSLTEPGSSSNSEATGFAEPPTVRELVLADGLAAAQTRARLYDDWFSLVRRRLTELIFQLHDAVVADRSHHSAAVNAIAALRRLQSRIRSPPITDGSGDNAADVATISDALHRLLSLTRNDDTPNLQMNAHPNPNRSGESADTTAEWKARLFQLYDMLQSASFALPPPMPILTSTPPCSDLPATSTSSSQPLLPASHDLRPMAAATPVIVSVIRSRNRLQSPRSADNVRISDESHVATESESEAEAEAECDGCGGGHVGVIVTAAVRAVVSGLVRSMRLLIVDGWQWFSGETATPTSPTSKSIRLVEISSEEEVVTTQKSSSAGQPHDRTGDGSHVRNWRWLQWWLRPLAFWWTKQSKSGASNTAQTTSSTLCTAIQIDCHSSDSAPERSANALARRNRSKRTFFLDCFAYSVDL